MLTPRRCITVAAVVAAACTALAAPAASAAEPAARAVAHHGAPAGPLAALGDSYSSGEGAPPFEEQAGACDRSPQAWPELVGAALGRATVNLACSGAQTADVVQPFKGQPAQTAALAALEPRPGVVTITIGGNDAGFGPVLALCVAADCTTAVAQAAVFTVTTLPGRLARTYAAVRAAAPGARLVVVGYPRLFPATQAEVTGCPWLSSSERADLNRENALLDVVSRLVARRAHARFVETQDALRGHELCSKDPWLVPIGTPTVPSSSWAHPNPAGQRALAAAVTAALS